MTEGWALAALYLFALWCAYKTGQIRQRIKHLDDAAAERKRISELDPWRIMAERAIKQSQDRHDPPPTRKCSADGVLLNDKEIKDWRSKHV